MTVEERVLRLESAFATLTQLAVSASERDDQQVSWINELGAASANADARIAALADAQIRTEEVLASLTAQVGSLTARVDRLADLFERFIAGQHGNNDSTD